MGRRVLGECLLGAGPDCEAGERVARGWAGEVWAEKVKGLEGWEAGEGAEMGLGEGAMGKGAMGREEGRRPLVVCLLGEGTGWAAGVSAEEEAWVAGVMEVKGAVVRAKAERGSGEGAKVERARAVGRRALVVCHLGAGAGLEAGGRVARGWVVTEREAGGWEAEAGGLGTKEDPAVVVTVRTGRGLGEGAKVEEAKEVGRRALGECLLGEGAGWEAGARVARGWVVGETAVVEKGVEVRGAGVEVEGSAGEGRVEDWEGVGKAGG